MKRTVIGGIVAAIVGGFVGGIVGVNLLPRTPVNQALAIAVAVFISGLMFRPYERVAIPLGKYVLGYAVVAVAVFGIAWVIGV